MAKNFFFVLIFFAFLCAPLFAQENSAANDSDESDSAAEAVSSTDNSSEENGKGKKKFVAKIKESVKEFNEARENEQDERPVKAVQFLGDFLTDKLPLTVDFGAEPSEKGSSIFASVQYDWSERFSSRIRFDYRSPTEYEDNFFGYTKTGAKQYTGTLLPAVWYFGDASVGAKTALWSFGVGGFYSYIKQSAYTYLLSGNEWGSYDLTSIFHCVGPAFEASVKKPFGKFFAFGASLSLQPMYFIFLESDLKGRLYNGTTQSMSVSGRLFSAPTFTQAIWFDLFRFVRIKTLASYRRLEYDSFDVSGAQSAESEYIISHELSWRYGIELVLPSSNRTRKKDSHLWAGVYYQHEWSFTDRADDISSTYKGRWVICFGK